MDDVIELADECEKLCGVRDTEFITDFRFYCGKIKEQDLNR